ncbi:MAG: hypothetical protein WCD35_02725 [Mycobacteriales bacterium]
MRRTITWRDAVATAVTGALAASYVGLAQGQSWAPVTSVRWFAVLFLLAGQVACTVGAADAMAAGATQGVGFLLGPVALLATLTAVVTGSVTVTGVAVCAMVGLWLLTTSRHVLSGVRAVRS